MSIRYGIMTALFTILCVKYLVQICHYLKVI